MKSNAFWMLDACVLFTLSLIYLYQGFHRKNPLFTVWLCTGVLMQLVAAWGLAAGWPTWMDEVRVIFDGLMYLVTLGVLVLALMHRDCPVNRSLLWGLGAMVALNLFGRTLGASVNPPVRIWLRNIGFFGPAIFLLIALSNLRLDRLPVWISSTLRVSVARSGQRPAIASVSISTPEATSSSGGS